MARPQRHRTALPRRYLDLIVNPESRKVFILRSEIIAYIRQALVGMGFIEVETPMLHPIPGGANARPFETYHNALDMPLYMRIAPELYLKRLLVGGFDKVFEIGKNFRNEGISTRHNPEYTSLEAYQAYADYHVMMELTEKLISGAAKEARNGRDPVPGQGDRLDAALAAAFDVGGDPPLYRASTSRRVPGASRGCAEAGVRLKPGANAGQAILETFEQRVEEHLIQPVFITDHPVEVSPLAKRRADNPRLTERFEPYINGWELPTASPNSTTPSISGGGLKNRSEPAKRGTMKRILWTRTSSKRWNTGCLRRGTWDRHRPCGDAPNQFALDPGRNIVSPH